MDEKVRHIELGALIPSEANRTDLGNGDLKELAEDIKLRGIIVPLIARELEKGFEIVAGHRRYAAAKMAGVKEVPVLVRKLTDGEALETQIIENLHRKNLNPMEEARAFDHLRKGNVHTVQGIADVVGKDAKYVHRALSLLGLPAKAQRALEKGIISAAHGHQLARVGPKQMESVVAYAITPGWKDEIPSVLALKQEIGRRVEKDLSRAPFEKTKEYAGKVACKGCPSNSANQDMLFDGAEGGHCMNGACFIVKMNQFYKDLQAAGQKRWPNLKFIGMATSGYGDQQTIKGFKVIEAEDAKFKKWIKDHENLEVGRSAADNPYAFGILKPSNWGSVKAPKLVVLKKLSEKEAQKPQGYQRDPDEDYHWQFVRDYEEKNGKPLQALEEKAEKLRAAMNADAEAIWNKNKAAIVAEYKKLEAEKKS